jgi:hypothetical protein
MLNEFNTDEMKKEILLLVSQQILNRLTPHGMKSGREEGHCQARLASGTSPVAIILLDQNKRHHYRQVVAVREAATGRDNRIKMTTVMIRMRMTRTKTNTIVTYVKGQSCYTDNTAATAAESTNWTGGNYGANTPTTNHTHGVMQIHCGGTGPTNASAAYALNASGDNPGAITTTQTTCRLMPIALLEDNTNNGVHQDPLFWIEQKDGICSTAWIGRWTLKAGWLIINGANWLST